MKYLSMMLILASCTSEPERSESHDNSYAIGQSRIAINPKTGETVIWTAFDGQQELEAMERFYEKGWITGAGFNER